MGFMSPKAPSAPVIPPAPPAANPPVLATPAVSGAGATQRAIAAAAAGAGDNGTLTNVGGAAGLPTPDTSKAKLLG